MPFPFYPSWHDHWNCTLWRVQVIKLLIMQFSSTSCHFRARGIVVDWGTMLQAGRSLVRVQMRSLDFFLNLPNPSSRNTAQGSTQPLTEIALGTLLEGKGRPGRKADNFTSICEPIDCLDKMWEPRRLTTLWDFAPC
jgi:hypothetical protein